MKTQDTTETMIFLSLLNDECKCESLHSYVRCSMKVTHRVTDCDSSRLVCSNTAKKSAELRKTYTCTGCGRRAKNCWTIIPV